MCIYNNKKWLRCLVSAEFVTAYEGCLVGVLQMPVPKHVPYGFQCQLHFGSPMYCSLIQCQTYSQKNECWMKWTVVRFPGYCIKKAMEISPQGLMSVFTLSNCNKVLCNLCKVDTCVYEHVFYKVDGGARGDLAKHKWL